MADHTDQSDREPEQPSADLRRSRRAPRTTPATRPTAGGVMRRITRSSTASSARRVILSGRRIAVVGVVGALVATAAIPAFAATAAPEARTLQQVAADAAQSLVVASDQEPATLARNSYAATTAQEIDQKKAEEAAAARAKEAARLASLGSSSGSFDLNMVGPGTGAIRWPLAQVNMIGDGFRTRGGEHDGQDLIGPAGSVVFAATSGVVNVSSEGYYGYGVAVTIDTVINGQKVTTLYGHMRYGSRQVVSGQQVQVGQPLGIQGNTGNSYGEHLHFEVQINGNLVDPLAWLQANAG